MTTWRVSFTDPADRYITEQYDAKDAAYWQDHLRTRAKPGAGQPGGLQALVEHLAPEYGVDPAFASAIAQTESNYQPGVVSSAGAKGVMQLMDPTAKRFGVRDSFDPEQNIRGGLAYLRVLQDLFPGRRDLQMAAYNAGEGAVKKYGNTIPPYPETQDYVRKVSSRLARTTPQGAMVQAQKAAMQPLGSEPPSQRQDPALALPLEQEFLTPGMPPITDMTSAAPQEPSSQGTDTSMAEAWMPSPKPIEKAYRGGILGKVNALGASIGVGLTGAAASLLEAPAAALRMAGVENELGDSPLEAAATYLRETIIPRAQEAQAGHTGLMTQIGEGVGAGLTLFAPGIGVTRGIASVAANAPKIAAMLGATTSGVLQGTVAMNDTYRALIPLVGDEEAGKRAQTALVTNTVLGSIGSALGLFNPWLPGALSRVVVGAAVQGGQGGLQYDWNRRLFWVPAESEKAEALTKMGWKRQGDRVAQPYRLEDQLEAALVNAVVGGIFGAAAEYSHLPVPAGLKDVAKDPGFTMDRALQAAIAPEAPPADIELTRWQRWGNAILDLLPEPVPGGGGLLHQALGSQRGSISPQRISLRQQRRAVDEKIAGLERGGEETQAVLESLGTTDIDAAHDQLMTQRQQIVDDLAALPPEPVTPAPSAIAVSAMPTEAQGVREALQGATRTNRMMGEMITSPDPHAQAVLRNRDFAQLEAALAPHVQGPVRYIAGGFSSVVLDIGGGRVARLGTGRMAQVPNIPEMLQPTLQETIGNLRLEIYPRVETTGITAADVTQMAQDLQARGYDFPDAGTDNLGRLPDGRLVVVDPGAIEAGPALPLVASAAPQPSLPPDVPPGTPTTGETLRPTEAELAQAYQPEGQRPPSYRTESGRLRERLSKIPTRELEIQDAIKQPLADGRHGIKLTGETDLPDNLRALISSKETEIYGLLNNRSGLSLNEMAQRLKDADFIKTADKESLLAALEESVNRGVHVYSAAATGHIPLMDSPGVAAAYASLQELVRNFSARTEEQRRGTRPHAVAISEAQAMITAGGWTRQDILDMFPGTIMDDTGIAQVVLTARETTNQMIQAAQKVMETGGRDPQAIEDYLTIKSMFADIHVAVTGVAAESGRILSMWNDPMAPHKRYMDGLKDLMLQHGNETALKMARADLSLATPEEAALAQQLRTDVEAKFQEKASRGWLAGPDFAPMRDDWMQQQTLFPADQINETWATVMGDEMPLAVSPDPSMPPLPEGQGPGLPYHLAQSRSPLQMRREVEGQRRAVQDFVRKMREEAGLPSEAELQQRRHAADPLSRMHDPSVEELPLFTPSELEPRLKQALGWELLTPDERRAAQTALQQSVERYATEPFSPYHTGQRGEDLPLLTAQEMGLQELVATYGSGLPAHLQEGRSRYQIKMGQEEYRRAVQDFRRKLQEEAGLPSDAAMREQAQQAEPLSTLRDVGEAQPSLFLPSELQPKLRERLQWDNLSAQERTLVQEMNARYAQYRRRPGMTTPEEAAQPLMLGVDPLTAARAPSDVRLAREARLDSGQLRVLQANLGQAQPGKWAMYLEQKIAAMLGPVTWLANATASTGMGIYNIPVRFFAGAASQVRQGAERLGNQLGTRDADVPIEPGVSMWEWADLLYGASQGWSDNLRAIGHAWRTGESRIDPGEGKIDLRYPKAVTAENLGLEGTTVGKFAEFWGEYVGFLSGGRTAFRVLNTTDEAYLGLFYNMGRQALAQSEARRQGLEGLPRAEVMAKVMADPNVAEWIHNTATEEAKYLTMRSDLPTEGVASLLKRFTNWQIRPDDLNLPAGRLLSPFYTVPTNAAIATVDNTPLALLSSKFYGDLNAGGRKADLAMGKLIAGSLTTAAVAGLVGSMVITGRAPSDPVQREIWRSEHPEYSAYVPLVGIWVDYRRWLGPLGTGIAVVADTAQLMGELEGSVAARLGAAAYLSLSRNLVGQTGWKDISDFLEILNGGRNIKSEDASGVLKSLNRYVRQELIGMIPGVGSANMRALTRAMDPEEKMIKNYVDEIYSQMPWGSQNVARKVTITGEPELYGLGVGPEMLQPITRAFFPGLKAMQAPLDAASRAIQDNNMRLSKMSDTLQPIGVIQARSDVDTLKGIQGLKLTPAEHERLQVLGAMNEQQAQKLYSTTERVIPPETMQLVTHAAALRAQAAADPSGASPFLMPPKDEMSLSEMWNWLTTTPAFERGGTGRGSGKEKAFQTAVQEYQKWGQELFLELEPDIGGKHAQSRIQQQIQPFAPEDRESMRETLEKAHTATRPAMRGVMGLPALNAGGL